MASDSTPHPNPHQPTVIVQVPHRRWTTRVLLFLLMLSVMMNLILLASQESTDDYTEEYVSGSRTALDRIAILEIEGTIMPPFTERILKMIDRAEKNDKVLGVILAIDSPGGLVADSHQIYRALQKLSGKKPVYVAMKRIAASGGVYVAMGVGEKGKIYAEPTTWTGSIGVIIPRYDLSELADKVGIASDSLTTGVMKDSMNPLKPLPDAERAVWAAIMNESFDRFVKIVAEGRAVLDEKTVREKLATGQVFTAIQAKEHGLIDDIAFEDEVIDKLKADHGIGDVKVVRYKPAPTLIDVLMGDVQSRQSGYAWQQVLEATVPRALYYCSWLPALPGLRSDL